MDNTTYEIEVTCLFCEATLKVEEGREYQSGDLIKCPGCGEENDYDSVMDVAKEKGIEVVKADVTKDLEKRFKKMFKNF